MSHQQFSQMQGRLPQSTAPARPVQSLGSLGQQLSSSFMPTRGIGGVVGTQALATGLEELKRQADNWMQDQQATHQRNEVMSAKLREQEKTNKTLQKEKEQLQVEVRDLKARIREDCHAAQAYYDKLQLVESMQSTLLEQAARAEEQIRHIECYRVNMEKAINNQGRFCHDIEDKYDELTRVQLATAQERDQALGMAAKLEAELQEATKQLAVRGNELDKATSEHDMYKAHATAIIETLTLDLEAAKTACANTTSELNNVNANYTSITKQMAKLQEDHTATLSTLQEAHTSALNDNRHELEDLQQQLQVLQGRAKAAESDLNAANNSNEKHSASISKLQEELKDMTAACDETATKLSNTTTRLEEVEAQVTSLTAREEELQQQLSAANLAAEVQAAEAADVRANLETRLEGLRAAHTQASEAHEALQQDLQALQEQHITLQADTEVKEAELHAAKSTGELAAQTATCEIESLKEQLNKERIASRKNTESVAKRMDEMKASVNKAKELTKEVEALKAHLDQQKADMDAALTAQQKRHTAALDAQKALAATTGDEAAKLAAELVEAQDTATKQLLDAQAEAAKAVTAAVAQVQATAAKEKEELTTMLQDAVMQLERLKLEKMEGIENMDSVTQQLLDQEAALKTLQAATGDALAELQSRLDTQLKMTEHLDATVQEKEAETVELKEEVTELKAANKELQAQCDETQAALEEKETILGNIQSNLAIAAAAQPQAPKVAPKSTAPSSVRAGTRRSGARVSVAKNCAGLEDDGAHFEEEEQMTDEDDAEDQLQDTRQQRYSVSQRTRQGCAAVAAEVEEEKQLQDEEQHYADVDQHMEQQQDDVIQHADDAEEQEFDEPMPAPGANAGRVSTAALRGRAAAAGARKQSIKHATATPAAGIKSRTGAVPATACGKQQRPGSSRYSAGKTPQEFGLATKTPYHAQAEPRPKKVSIGGTQTIPSAAVVLAKKRARVVEPGYYADITSSLAGTQAGDDDDDDAGYGGHEDEHYAELPAAKRITAPAMVKSAAAVGNNNRRVTAAPKPAATKHTASGAIHNSRPAAEHQVSQQQQRKTALAKPTASGKAGGAGGHRGRLGGMSMSVSGMSMERYGGVEVSSGAQSRRLKQQQQQRGAAAGRSGRMAPPAPKFQDEVAAQEKAAAAEKQSAAFDIFGAVGMF